MKLTSPAFSEGENIPKQYTGVSDDTSPSLAWTDVPASVQSFALICDDPDAPSRANPRPQGPWVHWVIYNIPTGDRQLPESVERKAHPDKPVGAVQGVNDFDSDNIGYRGPMPPPGSGPHRYFFRLYALDCKLDLAAKDANKHSLLKAMEGHILAQAELMGQFERR
jgi:Raf kinase inhibitor-like YbhB/YbcL family protein